MRQFFLSVALAAVISAPVAAPGLAQDFSPVVYVNNAVVTEYEIQQRMRFMQVLNAPEQGRDAAEKALIEDRLRNEAARQIGVEVSDVGLEQGLSEFAGRAGLSTGEFIQVLERSGVERQAYRDFVKAGVAWREVVRQRIAPSVAVSDAELDQALKRIVETPLVTQVLISELIIPAPPGQEQAVMAQAEALTQSVRSEAAFADAARRLSATPSAARGGRLEWMAVDNMPPSLRPIILGLQPGQMTPPLSVSGAVVLFFLRDTRGELRPGAREQQLDYLQVTYASTAEAQGVAAQARSCEELYVFANGLPDQQVQRVTGGQGSIPSGIAVRLASLDENEATVIDRGGAADLVMLCDRTPVLLAGLDSGPVATATTTDGETVAAADSNALPERESVREQIFNRKITQAADAYLAELRADAVIRRN
ncbi:peptidyl-prolyl cis-trans isomerase SurA [Paracoccus isoporae]|uniref:Parvulin-like PPIase n=1 Tax=Paracoccus isoporae TaxID=591205 RepID=A0A1G6TK87_9RHOB|nr:peptidylprolyl isomerase [Paracoccus isoporae]SDD29284.1 peptidyl-prolyl cis-trans isomerase SurA [Paracoccus isoporae]